MPAGEVWKRSHDQRTLPTLGTIVASPSHLVLQLCTTKVVPLNSRRASSQRRHKLLQVLMSGRAACQHCVLPDRDLQHARSKHSQQEPLHCAISSIAKRFFLCVLQLYNVNGDTTNALDISVAMPNLKLISWFDQNKTEATVSNDLIDWTFTNNKAVHQGWLAETAATPSNGTGSK